MKIYFDIDLISSQKFGMTIATLELMKALKAQGVTVVNFAAGGAKSLLPHIAEMTKEEFKVYTCPIPRKVLRVTNRLGLNIEGLFLGKYDFFIQIGLHQNRNIPAAKYIISIHDTVGLRYPENEAPFPVNASSIVKKANMILTVSEFSKQEIITFFDCNKSKIKVIPNGCNFERFTTYSHQQISAIKTKYQLPEEYLLTYGGKSPRKNIDFLVKAYSNWEKENKPELVLFGHKLNDKIPGLISLGYISDQDVPLIVAGAKAIIFPSYYEGFGMPVLEAFACGVPVICANSSSLPEVSKGNALFFDPKNENDLIAKLNTFTNNPLLATQLKEKGLSIVKSCTWDNAAKQLLEMIQ